MERSEDETVKKFLIYQFLFLLLFNHRLVYACPDIDGMLDLNCDGEGVIVAFGDSITDGVGDSSGLGYPGRLNLLFPSATVYNLRMLN